MAMSMINSENINVNIRSFSTSFALSLVNDQLEPNNKEATEVERIKALSGLPLEFLTCLLRILPDSFKKYA